MKLEIIEDKRGVWVMDEDGEVCEFFKTRQEADDWIASQDEPDMTLEEWEVG